MNALVEMKGLHKSFGGIQALKGVDLTLYAGEVHGLLGENGAGKSTLMRILCGLQTPDQGTVLVNGKEAVFHTPRAAQELGIGMIPQELILIDGMTLAENIFLGREILTRSGLLNHKAMIEATRKLMESLGCPHLDPESPLGTLSKADQQMAALARRIVQGGTVFVMDEPTSALTEKETQQLFSVIRKVCSEGKAVVFISHRLEEVLEICNRFTILRDGELVAALENNQTLTKNDLIAPMIGNKIKEEFPHEPMQPGETLLETRNLSFQTDQNKTIANVNFSLRAGQVLGITGLVGMGKSELAQTLAGLRRKNSGLVMIKGKETHINSPVRSRKLGIGYVTEDRRGEGLILQLRSLFNMTLRSLGVFSRWLVIKSRTEKQAGREYARQLSMKPLFLDMEVGKLSGGNQQKVVVIRQMMADAEIILFDEPTKGIDVGAKVEIARLISRLSQENKGICIFSSEPREVLGISDIIYVLNHEGFQGPFPRGSLDYKDLMALEFGVAEQSGE